MLNVRLAGDHLYGKIAVHLAGAGNVFDGVFLCCPVSHEMSWMRSGTYSRTSMGRTLMARLPRLFRTRS